MDDNKKRDGSKEKTAETRGNMRINVQTSEGERTAADFPLTNTRKGPTGNTLGCFDR